MQPPPPDFPPDDSQNPPPSPTVFEAAPSPANSPAPRPTAPDFEAPIYRPGIAGAPAPRPIPPLSDDVFAPRPAPQSAPLPGLAPPPISSPFTLPTLPVAGGFSHRIARWRWAMSLLLVGFYPLFLSLLARARPRRAASDTALPSSVRALIVFSLVELGIFGAFWALGWLFSRATKDELLLRWRGGAFKPVWQGFGYAFALRVGLAIAIVLLATLFLMATGTDPKQFGEFMKQNQPNTDSLFPPGALSNPLYLFLMMTLLSFVVAGLREELWRTVAFAALRHLFPDSWSERARWVWSILLSSVVFGLGHLYQGPMGVAITGVLGAGLGWVTWRHRSIWPAVFAHGFIDASSFLAAAVMEGKKVPVSAFLFGG